MNKKCFLLMKVQLSGQFKRKEKNRGSMLVFAAYVFLGLVVAAYSFLVAFGLGAMELSHVIPGYALAITSLITLFFTTIKANGILFAYRDYDLLMSLPIKTGTVIASRFLTMYVMNVLFTAAVMLPMGVGYVIWAGPGIEFYPIWLIGILTAPLIPTTIATVLGSLIILFTSRFRHANILTTILTMALVCGIMALSFGMGNVEEENIAVSTLAQMGEMLSRTIHKIYPPAILFDSAVVSQNLPAFLAFVGTSAAWYLIFIKLVSLKYKSMNTGLMTWHTRADYKVGVLKTSSPVMAVCKKEAKRFFGCPAYATNMGMGVVLMLLFGVAVAVMGMEKLEQWIEMPGMAAILVKMLPFMIAMLQCMSCTSCVSLSLEGKSLWILKSLPLEKKTIYQGKLLFNLLLTIPAGLLVSFMIAVRIPMDWGTRLLLFCVPVVYTVFISVLGIYFNIKMPKYDWTNETVVVKQSASSMAGIFGGMLNALIPLFLMLVLRGVFAELFAAVLVVLEGALAFVLYRHVCTLDF